MTFNKISRAGLLALAFGLLLGLFINIGLHDAAFAQTQDAPAPAAAAAMRRWLKTVRQIRAIPPGC
jgi:hypothetical protein